MAIKKILWPSDASPSALRALQTAVELAKTFGADLYGLQVISRVPILPRTGFVSPEPTAFDVPFYEQQLLEEIKKSLRKTMTEQVPGGITVASAVQLGEPDEVILELVREKKIDLIVMATHGRTGFARFFLGSVAERVIRGSPVPVLAVPALPEE